MHEGHRDRMRERILNEGMLNFQEHEVLEYLLYAFVPRKDTNEIAHRLIETFGSLAQVLDAGYEELREFVSDTAAVFLCSLPDVQRKYMLSKAEKRPVLNKSSEAIRYFSSFMSTLVQEEIYMACLDSAGRLIKRVHLQKGVVNESNLYVRDVIHYALKFSASGVILAHNHPSANVKPSQADIDITKKCSVALSLISVPLLDHIIVGMDACYSFKKDGKLDAFREGCMVRIFDGKVTDYHL